MNVQKMSQVEIDRAALEIWQTPAENPELHLWHFYQSVDGLTDAIKHKDGWFAVRKDARTFLQYVQKVIDIKNDLAPLVIAKAD